MNFTHETLPQRVVFASGQAFERLPDEVARLGERPLVITTRAADVLPGATHHREVAMHVPVEVAERATAAADGHDVLVGVGGGSTTGLAKAVALSTGLPIVAVPTTFAGSEATDVWGRTENGRKTTGSDRRVLPRTVVYDATLTMSLPAEMAVASGINALAHCVDSLWAPRADPINQALSLAGLNALRDGLPRADLAGREQTLYGAYLAAVAFASAGSGLHHKICHVLGGMFALPHAQTHAVVLPQVLALNAPAVPRFAASLAEVPPLLDRVGAPRALRDYGFQESDIPAAAEAILAVVPAGNPVPVTIDDLTALLHRAWSGEEPQ